MHSGRLGVQVITKCSFVLAHLILLLIQRDGHDPPGHIR